MKPQRMTMNNYLKCVSLINQFLFTKLNTSKIEFDKIYGVDPCIRGYTEPLNSRGTSVN